jgi:pyridoxal phosphate enzyme (YggS family)
MLNSAAVIAENIARVRERIAKAAESAGRSADDVSLMAVTKFHPAEAVRCAYLAGVRCFGENRVQEAQAKYRQSAHRSRVFPAHDRYASEEQDQQGPRNFRCGRRHRSIDILTALLARVASREEPLRLYLELHTGEDSKAGFPNIDELLRACDVYAEFLEQSASVAERVVLCGLMTMAPFTQDTSLIRRSFRMLAAAKREVEKRFHFPNFCELSMGMSNDFEVAIQEGSTLVRIGTAIFGERDVQHG